MWVQRRDVVVSIIALGVGGTGCAAANSTSTARAAAPEPSVGSSSTPPTSTTTTTSPPTTTTSSSTTTEPDTALSADPFRTVVATARSSIGALVAYEEPDGAPMALPFVVPNPHQFGGPLTLMVTEGDIGDEWVKVQLPIRPNGTEGWIPTEHYALGETFMRSEVILGSTSVRVFDGDRLITETQAAIGTDATPTPVGTFYVASKRRNPPEEQHLGEWSIVLSSFSEVLDTFSDGLPVIAIHGTHHPDDELGQGISNGCVRVTNDVMQLLAEHLPLGAPVIIST